MTHEEANRMVKAWGGAWEVTAMKGFKPNGLRCQFSNNPPKVFHLEIDIWRGEFQAEVGVESYPGQPTEILGEKAGNPISALASLRDRLWAIANLVDAEYRRIRDQTPESEI